MSDADVAERLAVDVRTVQRWRTGRVPYPKFRHALARLLDSEERHLWPDVISVQTDDLPSDLASIWPQRRKAPPDLWLPFFRRAQSEIAIFAYAALFLPEQHVDLIHVLREKAAGGCRVRIALGDPDSPKLVEREREEEYGEGIDIRVRAALRHYEPLHRVEGAFIHVHATTLYASIYRSDDELLVNTHVYGENAFAAPLLHLRRQGDGGLFDVYAGSLEKAWAASRVRRVRSERYPQDVEE